MNEPFVDILMYHSISEGSGPTCIGPDVFRQQVAVLAECGYRGVALADLTDWLSGGEQPAGKVVALTFDDGFEDFATVALPELQSRGWTATVFLPAGKVDGFADWDNPPTSEAPRRLMSWATVTELARLGIEFGAHGASHADLTALPPAAARDEIITCKRLIEDHIGRPVTSFAAPFGRTSPAIRAEVQQHYRLAVGTRLARARPASDPYDLPRLEMWYFRNPQRWQSYLEGGARGYFLLRQLLRRARALTGIGRRAVPVSRSSEQPY